MREGDVSGAMKALEESPQSSRDLTLHGPQILSNLMDLLPQAPPPPCRGLDTYGLIPPWDRSKALILHGLSGLGKSNLARSLMPTALFCSQIEDIKKFNKKIHEGIIFDDMNFMGDDKGKGRWPREAMIHLVDYDFPRSIHCRYLNATVPAGTPKIFTTNLSPREILLVSDTAIRRRITSWFVEGTVGALEITVQY